MTTGRINQIANVVVEPLRPRAPARAAPRRAPRRSLPPPPSRDDSVSRHDKDKEEKNNATR